MHSVFRISEPGRALRVASGALAIVLLGCEAKLIQTKDIGAEGGVVEVDGLALSIPEGALTENTTITVERLNAVPAEYSAWMKTGTAIYRLSPAGLHFAKDVEVRVAATQKADYIGAMWTDEAAQMTFVAFSQDGEEIVARANHFSTFGFLSWQHVKESAWTLATVAVDGAGLAGDALYLLGSLEMVLLCKAAGRGDEGEPPCPGPYLADGNRQPLCFAPTFAGDKKLRFSPQSNLCELADCPAGIVDCRSKPTDWPECVQQVTQLYGGSQLNLPIDCNSGACANLDLDCATVARCGDATSACLTGYTGHCSSADDWYCCGNGLSQFCETAEPDPIDGVLTLCTQPGYLCP